MRKSFRIDGIEVFVDPRQDLVVDDFRGIYIHKTHAKCRKELDLVIAYKYIEEEGYTIMREVLNSGDMETVMDEYFSKLVNVKVTKVIENIEKLPSEFRRSVLYYFARRLNDLPHEFRVAFHSNFGPSLRSAMMMNEPITSV